MSKPKDKRVRAGYDKRSNAICVVAYDLAGKPIAPETARKVVRAVERATEKERLAILYTQQ
jgi:hypothetical protein